MQRTWVRGAWLAVLISTGCGKSSRLVDQGESGGVGGSIGGGTGGTGAAGKGGTLGKGGSAGKGGTSGKGGSAGKGGSGKGGAGTGGSTGDACITDPDALDGQSFEFSWRGTGREELQPSMAHFTRAADGGLELLVGTPGQAFRGPLFETSSDAYGPSLELRDALPVHVTPVDYRGNSEKAGVTLTLTALTLCVTAPENEAWLLAGEGGLNVYVEYDDSWYSDDLEITLAGSSDVASPYWIATEAFDPLAPPLLVVSEPLSAGAAVWLQEKAERIELTAVEQSGAVVGFQIPKILPLGATAILDAQATDLVEHELERNDDLIRTLDDPGIQPLDGFESELRAIIAYNNPISGFPPDLELATGDQALEGAKSLFVRSGMRVLLHLARPSGTTTLRFGLRPVVESLGDYVGEILIRAGVVGGAEVAAATLRVSDLDDPDGSGGAAGAAGAGPDDRPIESVSLALDEAGADAVLSIETPFVDRQSSLVVHAIVDGLRFE